MYKYDHSQSRWAPAFKNNNKRISFPVNVLIFVSFQRLQLMLASSSQSTGWSFPPQFKHKTLFFQRGEVYQRSRTFLWLLSQDQFVISSRHSFSVFWITEPSDGYNQITSGSSYLTARVSIMKKTKKSMLKYKFNFQRVGIKLH